MNDSVTYYFEKTLFKIVEISVFFQDIVFFSMLAIFSNSGHILMQEHIFYDSRGEVVINFKFKTF